MNRVQYRILAAAWYASIYRIKWSKQVSHMSFIAYVYVSLHMYTFFLTFVLIVHTTAYVHEYIDVEHISMHAKCVLQCVSQCVATCCGVCCSVCCCALLTIHWCTHRRYIVCTLLIFAAQQLCIRIDTHATHCNTHRSAPSNIHRNTHCNIHYAHRRLSIIRTVHSSNWMLSMASYVWFKRIVATWSVCESNSSGSPIKTQCISGHW